MENTMDQLEKVEKIREKTGVSYEDAKKALEESNNDILDAIVYLEKQGKIASPGVPSYSTKQEEQQSEAFEQAQQTYEKDCSKKSAGDVFRRFGHWCTSMLKRSCEITFEITRNGEQILSVPLLLFLLCVIVVFWFTIVLLIVGLFLDCRYQFRGLKKSSIDINDVCGKASDACETIKQDLQGDKDHNQE